MGIDVGGTGTKYALVDTSTGDLLTERFKFATPKPATPEAIGTSLISAVKHLDWSGPVGIGMPCIVKKGRTLSAANIDKGWIDFDAAGFLEKKLNLPVTMVNDADAAGIAEMSFGKGKDKDGLVLMVTLGTGIGSALFIDGKLIPNTEYGHLKFKGGIAEKYAANSIRKELGLDWEEWSERLCELLAHFERVFNPDMFILGGGVSKKFDIYGHMLKTSVPIVPAALQNAAGVIGAACLAAKQTKRREAHSRKG